MGYSLAVKFKTKDEQEKMYNFYVSQKEIIKEMSLVEGRDDGDDYTDLHWDDRLSYSPKVKFLLGYDGPSGRPYYFELLLAWMAVKSSFRDKTENPFIYYDREKIYVNSKNGFNILVNAEGIQTLEQSSIIFNTTKKKHYLYEVTDFDLYIKKINDLFVCLNNNWNDYVFKIENKKVKMVV